MKMKQILAACFMVFGALVNGVAQASLVDRGGGLIYDTTLNVTWLQDANYAKTSGYDADGLMTWEQANTWSNTLTFSGISGWRLPTTTDMGALGCNWSEPAWGGGGTDCGYSVSPASSEMAHLFHVSLQNNALNTWPWASNEGNGLQNVGPFNQVQRANYWSGTPYALDQNSRWFFSFAGGLQREGGGSMELYAWAVHEGDVASIFSVPEPATTSTMVLGLALMSFFIRQQKPSK